MTAFTRTGKGMSPDLLIAKAHDYGICPAWPG